jgi:undecaprenyl-diphosphatase
MFSWAVIHTFTRIYLGVHYPGDITFGALEGLIVGSLVYLLYNSLQKRLFTERHYSASQYVSEEYPNSDLKLFYVTFILILLAIFLLGIGVAYFKYL